MRAGVKYLYLGAFLPKKENVPFYFTNFSVIRSDSPIAMYFE
jgi:hypothetical protein